MQWFMASVNGIGDVVFKADPDKMDEPSFEIQKLACVVSHPQRGLGLSKWVGHFAKLVGPVGRLNSKALGICYPIQDNEFIKKAEELGTKERAEGPRLVLPGEGGFPRGGN
jgi:hypothetical protein